MDEYGSSIVNTIPVSLVFPVIHFRKSAESYRVANISPLSFPLTQASTVVPLNITATPLDQDSKYNVLINPILKLNPFLLTGSRRPCTLTNPHLNQLTEVAVSSYTQMHCLVN